MNPPLSGRFAGILLHPTSLPGPHGMGELGEPARRFAGVLSGMGMAWWQMLPIGPTGYGDSPYQSPSTFAGNPLLIGLDELATDGLLEEGEPDDHPSFPSDHVEFGDVIPARMRLLTTAVDRFEERAGSDLQAGFGRFCERHGETWLSDFSLFTALKREHGLSPWWEWERDLVRRRPAALRKARSRLEPEVRRIEIEQFLFDLQFRRLRDHADRLGIGLIGDIPIFVAHDSADVWANPELFFLDGDGMPTVVAGVPPDYFSETGQRWGNPLYDWDRHRAQGFEWWDRRMSRMFELFDLVRVDHFRGFAASWHIPADEPTAVNGEWVEAPGRELFEALQARHAELPVIAEDLGLITDDVEELRDHFGFPGMKVLQFGFGTESAHALEEFRPDVVAYTGTHDNDTALGWFRSNDEDREAERRAAMEALDTDGSEFHWDMIRAVFESVADTAIVPMQDVLGLDTSARMNTPAVETGNWRWRFEWDQLTPDIVRRMARLVRETGRASRP